MPAPSIIVVAMLPAAVILSLLVWGAIGIGRALMKNRPIQAGHCLLIGVVLVVIDLAVSFMFSAGAWLSHSEAAKQKVPYYWLLLFIVIVVLPSTGLYALHKWSKKDGGRTQKV